MILQSIKQYELGSTKGQGRKLYISRDTGNPQLRTIQLKWIKRKLLTTCPQNNDCCTQTLNDHILSACQLAHIYDWL